ncbi:MAG: hypothetical protein M0R48_10095 [Candidatus Omnitrophica bacterium]|nr:hypothetical protein [Candidatus Omnitrophota bacterium]
MNYATTVNKDLDGDTMVALPFLVSPTDFPMRIRTNYLEMDDSLELQLVFQQGHERRIPVYRQPVEMEVGQETGRVYRCVVHNFREKRPLLKDSVLLHEFRNIVVRENEKNTFLFCLVALTEVMEREINTKAGQKCNQEDE